MQKHPALSTSRLAENRCVTKELGRNLRREPAEAVRLQHVRHGRAEQVHRQPLEYDRCWTWRQTNKHGHVQDSGHGRDSANGAGSAAFKPMGVMSLSLSCCSCLPHCFRVKRRYAQARSTTGWTLLTEPDSSGWTRGIPCTSQSFCKYLLVYRELQHPDDAQSGCRRAVHQGRVRMTQPCPTQAAWACSG